ncbi:hypothetical protein [Vreelandella olivaria]|uniref:hypothetical protein n=1 Tax=Vreelandella olivaria TaxID=390919 RepID=UPI00201E8A2B|nr:hypothetical protein [Halomonas olivaria]
MTDIDKSGTFHLGTRTVKRLGYGAVQLAGPGVFAPPKDREAALAVLRENLAAAELELPDEVLALLDGAAA